MLGCQRRPMPLPDTGLSARAALEAAILPALLRPPCLVSFSGGRDSSAVLAVATSLARREGLDLPVPATNVFPDAIGADEADWQSLVVSHLGLQEWLRIEYAEELDVLGPYARRIMRRHGLLLPCNVHFHVPLLDAATGGSLLTGAGGDEVFSAARYARPTFDRGVIASAAQLGSLGLARAPQTVRRAVARRRQTPVLPWLRADAQRAVTEQIAAVSVSEPRTVTERLAWWRGLRYLGDGKRGLSLAADDADALLVHPFLEPQFWASVGRVAGPTGFANRTHGMVSLFADLLPDALLRRGTKAHFDQALWTSVARRFARDWDGRGVPSELVDVDALYRHWNGPNPSAQSFTLLQSAWLAGAGHRLQESVDGLLV